VPDRRRIAALLLQPRTWVAPYVALWFAVGLLPIQPTDMDIFFWPSAHIAVDGRPLLVYTSRGQADYPNANGPVSLVPLTALGLGLKIFGAEEKQPIRRALALALFSLFWLLMAREALRAVERARAEMLSGYPRLLALGTFAMGPPLWQSLAGYGHIEQPMETWLVLLAVRWLDERHDLNAGVAFALAVMSRSSAILLAVPLAIFSWRRGPAAFVRFACATTVAGAAVLAPFLLADPSDVLHSLFGYRGGLVVGAGSIWSLAHGTSLEPIVQRWDIVPISAAVLAANLFLASRPGGFTQLRLFAAMALTSAGFALLAKTVWPYYFVEVYIFGTVWAFARWRPAENPVRLVFFPLAISVYGLVAEIGSAEGLPANLVAIEGAGMFVMVALTTAWIAVLAAGPREARPGMVASPTPFQG
jgi:hypothetical protein